MNDFYVVEFIEDYQGYRKGQRVMVWKFNIYQYVKANSDMEYIHSRYVKQIYKIKFEEINFNNKQ